MTDFSTDFSWVEDLLDRINLSPPERQTFMEIMGVAHRELQHSNVLAFFLDKTESHGFGDLFFGSLTNLIKKKTEKRKVAIATAKEESSKPPPFVWQDSDDMHKWLSGDFGIWREWKNIDLLIQSGDSGVEEERDEESQPEGEKADENPEANDWALIIENKIWADLYNDLDEYWNRVSATHKIGVVLSLLDETGTIASKEASHRYVNITHQELMEEVLSNLNQQFMEADSGYLLFLQDYFSQIKKLTHSQMDQEAFNNGLSAFQEKGEAILQLQQETSKLHQEVQKIVIEVFAEEGWENQNVRKQVASLHFYPENESQKAEKSGRSKPKWTRFYIDLEYLLYHNHLYLTCELFGEGTEFGSEMRKFITDAGLLRGKAKIGMDGRLGGGWYHLILLDEKLTGSGGLRSRLKAVLEESFFKNEHEVLRAIAKKMDEYWPKKG